MIFTGKVSDSVTY